MREYIQSDMSSWEHKRDSGIRTIWNGATKQDHEDAQAIAAPVVSATSTPPPPASTPPPQPVKVCYGLDAKKYGGRDTISENIDIDFCPHAVAQGGLDSGSGSLQKTYLAGTPEEVSIAMEWSPGLAFKPDLDLCKKNLHEVLDGCDTNAPRNWKGGGTYQDGAVKYRFDPISIRQPAAATPWGNCSINSKAFYADTTIFGAGWLDTDFGLALRDNIKKKAVSPTKWKFKYENGDQNEWKATFRTVIGPEKQIERAIKDEAHFEDWGINCNTH
jgi:hypothetical protein